MIAQNCRKVFFLSSTHTLSRLEALPLSADTCLIRIGASLAICICGLGKSGSVSRRPPRTPVIGGAGFGCGGLNAAGRSEMSSMRAAPPAGNRFFLNRGGTSLLLLLLLKCCWLFCLLLLLKLLPWRPPKYTPELPRFERYGLPAENPLLLPTNLKAEHEENLKKKNQKII